LGLDVFAVNPTPKTVLEMIYEWSLTRPLWQRDALRRIIARGSPGDVDLQELVSLCKKENGDESVTASSKPLEKRDLPANPGTGQSLALVSIAEVLGVNQLAASQVLEFEPGGLTIIYGDNGAGKSGYARLLKRACRARYPGEIMPNAYDPGAPKQASASIVYSVAGAPTSVAWVDSGTPHDVLSAVSVFDRESGAVHVRNRNEVAFRPFGLDIPDELAEACQGVKATLQKEQGSLEKGRDSTFETPEWRSDTAAGKALNGLDSRTSIDTLRKLATTTEAEKARYKKLAEDLCRLLRVQRNAAPTSVRL
jgi:energy-coupling factor transporter ATP-binding protein EcfA2